MPVSSAPKQHQAGAYYRKILMRRQLLRFTEKGAAYVPFIGDGDIANDVFADRKIYGADLDPARAARARSRLARSEVLVADCDGFPFAGKRLQKLAIADIDPYRNPYKGFRAFWAAEPPLTRTFVVIFTDGQRQALMRVGKYELPDGTEVENASLNERRRIFHAYLSEVVWPWFDELVAPWQVIHRMRYLHGWMVYWGAVLRMPTTASARLSPVARRSANGLTPKRRKEVLAGIAAGMRLSSAAEAAGVDRSKLLKALDEDEKFAEAYREAEDQAGEAVEEALYQAAVSGNVQAARIWLEARGTPAAAELVPTGSRVNRIEALNALADGPDAYTEEAFE